MFHSPAKKALSIAMVLITAAFSAYGTGDSERPGTPPGESPGDKVPPPPCLHPANQPPPGSRRKTHRRMGHGQRGNRHLPHLQQLF